tara:strand:- start:1157 stop:1486 length:330 start_codon:yes stop_codon:yes gene_type:complete
MNKLTDLEICKRIAEIEKLPHHLEEGMNDKFINTSTIYGDVCEYNPLTDDALLNQLIFKYEISVSFNFCLISMITDKQYEMNFHDIPSLKRKCLLLIIKAHKELNNGRH